MKINNKIIKILSPGRTCLFGDHQDYLGLPVIACAINKYISLNAFENSFSVFKIQLPDIGEERLIDIHDDFKILEKRFKELIEKNKVIIMMSGTIHSEKVLKNI